MKRILFVLNDLIGGGAEKVFMTLLGKLDTNLYEIDIFIIKNIGVYINDLPKNVNFSFLVDEYGKNVNLPKTDTDIQKLYNLNINKSYDYEIAYIEGQSMKFLANSTNVNSIKYVWIHTDLSAFHYTAMLFSSIDEEGRYFDRFNNIFCVSDGVKECIDKMFPIIKNKTVTLLNNIDKKDIIEKSNKYSVTYNKLTFVIVSSLSKHKGHHRLICASTKLLEEGYNFNLEIIGTGNQEIELKELVNNSRFKNNFNFHGFIKNPYPFISAANMLILASFAEGYPTVMCEAMTLGIPIAGTECTGIKDVICDNEYGILLGNTEESIYMNLKNILDNPMFLEGLKDKSKKGSQRFGLEITIPIYEKYLNIM